METQDSGFENHNSRKAGRGRPGTGGGGGAVVLAILVATLSAFARERNEVIPGTKLTVQLNVYNYALVEAGELTQAQAAAAHVLRGAGVEAAWRDCPLAGEGASTGQECGNAHGVLAVRILPQEMAERLARDSGSLGFAQLGDNGAPGHVVSVFYDRVKPLAADLGCSKTVILGYAMAHEIGHLLLGADSHCPNGVMRANWTEKELLSASTGRFGFFPWQAARMRAEVRRRMGLPREGGALPYLDWSAALQGADSLTP